MYLSKSMRFIIVVTFIICRGINIDAKIPLTELKGFSSCMNPEYIYLSPALGALYESYAKKFALSGEQTSEAVILLHELITVQKNSRTVGSDSPTMIGRYLEPANIGTMIGLVVQHKNGTIDEQALVLKIKDLLKRVLTKKQHEIKQAITDDLQKVIAADNKHYKQQEDTLIKLFDEKDRADLKTALLDFSRKWTKSTENVVMNKLNTSAQKELFAQLKDLQRNLKQNRTLLDTEQRALTVASPLLKDSMSALTHALASTISEEGKLYKQDNTTNMLLAILWIKAKNKDEIIEALNAIAEALTLEPDKLYSCHPQKPYTEKDYDALTKKTETEIAQMPLEDIVFARLAHTLYKGRPNTYAATYVNSFEKQLKSGNIDNHEKAILEALVASWSTINKSLCLPKSS